MKPDTRELQLADTAATENLGRQLAGLLTPALDSLVVYLYGNLGAGKTTLVRGFLRGMGHEGIVRSPTYTLVESYNCRNHEIFHLDLYRLADPEELEYLGIRDLQHPGAIMLVEWPQQGGGMLAPADIEIQLEYDGEQRLAMVSGCSAVGSALLSDLAT